MLLMSSGAGSALAHKTKKQPTNNAQGQYTEVVPPTISGRKHHRHTSTGAHQTTTAPGRTSTTHENTTAGTKHHHKTKGRKSNHHPTRKHVKPKPVVRNNTHGLSPRSGHTTGRLTAAVTNSSGGGISVWLLVILILVLVSGSVAGVLRYRRSR